MLGGGLTTLFLPPGLTIFIVYTSSDVLSRYVSMPNNSGCVICTFTLSLSLNPKP